MELKLWLVTEKKMEKKYYYCFKKIKGKWR